MRLVMSIPMLTKRFPLPDDGLKNDMTGTNSLRTNKRDVCLKGKHGGVVGSVAVTGTPPQTCGGALLFEPVLFRSVCCWETLGGAKREV